MALTTERPTTSAPAAAASSMTCSAPSPICEADRTSTPIDWASGGGSYGGFMTALGLARASDALAAGVDYSGIHDWSTFLSSLGEPIHGGDANRLATESSPIATIGQWHSPVLLVQADDDRAVPFQQAAELLEGLRSHHIDHDVIMIPNEIHDMARYASWMLLFNAADVYFDRQLDKRSAPAP